MQAKKLYFKHIYLTSGFAFSQELIEGKPAQQYKKRHACLLSGYWCWQNAQEHPQDILIYIRGKLCKR